MLLTGVKVSAGFALVTYGRLLLLQAAQSMTGQRGVLVATALQDAMGKLRLPGCPASNSVIDADCTRSLQTLRLLARTSTSLALRMRTLAPCLELTSRSGRRRIRTEEYRAPCSGPPSIIHKLHCMEVTCRFHCVGAMSSIIRRARILVVDLVRS